MALNPSEASVTSFHELVARLAAAQVENKSLRKIMVPQLNEEALNKLLGEQLLYVWMGSLLTGLKAYKDKNFRDPEEELAPLIGNVVTEEIRAKRQGMKSVNPNFHPNKRGGGGSFKGGCPGLPPPPPRVISLSVESLETGPPTVHCQTNAEGGGSK